VHRIARQGVVRAVGSVALAIVSLAGVPQVAGRPAVHAAEWPQWRGPARDGVAHDSPALCNALPPEGLHPVWTSEEIPSGNFGGWGSPVVAGGRVYLFVHSKAKGQEGDPPPKKYPWLPPEKRVGMTDEEYAEYERLRRDEDEMLSKFYDFRETVYALDAQTGQTLWKNEIKSVYTRFLQSGSPAVVDGRLYILGAGRRARCLDALTGLELWATRLPGEFRDEYMMSSFAVADGVAAVLCGHLFGLDAVSGEILWQGDEQQTRGTHSSPVVWTTTDAAGAGRTYFIVNVSGKDTICVEPRSGREVWRVESHANLSTPVVVGNRLLTYGDSRQKGLRCFEISPSGARELWAFQGTADKGSSPVVVGQQVFVQGERRLACVDLETGRARWTTTLDLANPQYTSLIAADGKVLYALDGLLMFAAEPRRYTPLIEGRFNKQGLLASEAAHRKMLGLDELEQQPGGLEKALRLYDEHIGRSGPLVCATPALADGRLYIRTARSITCYDLRAAPQAAAAE
jgi:outer membrane protein assembly factor BamB